MISVTALTRVTSKKVTRVTEIFRVTALTKV